jgi:hypothetical protein
MLSFSSFATDLEEIVKRVESEKQATCTKKNVSPFSMCFGDIRNCIYNVNYLCISHEGDFKLKVKMKEYYDISDGRIVTKVRGYTITKRKSQK